MSIDARVKTVMFTSGGVVLKLEDRPARPGEVAGCRGQEELKAPTRAPGAGLLCGCDVWGGSESIMLGDVEIARRIGYNRIEWTDPDNLIAVIREYRKAKGLDT